MHDDRTEIYGLPLVHPENTLEQDVLRLREAVTRTDSTIRDVREACRTDLQALENSKQDKTATVSVERGGTGSNTAATARGNLSVPSRTGEGAIGTWGISISGTAAAVPYAGITGKPTKLADAGITDALPLTGGTLTGALSTQTNAGSVTSGGGATFQVIGDFGNAAMFSFHRSGAYAINMGLDTDNAIRIGGWSQGAGVARWVLDAGGNMTSSLNVTAYSDVRLKKNITPITGALDMVKRLRAVYFTRVDDPQERQQIGVIAQEVREVFPQVVIETKATADSEDVVLSVAYANLVAPLIEAVKELAAEIEAMKAERA